MFALVATSSRIVNVSIGVEMESFISNNVTTIILQIEMGVLQSANRKKVIIVQEIIPIHHQSVSSSMR